MPQETHEIIVRPNGEWTDVTIDITRSDRSVRHYPDPSFVPLDLTVDEARKLAAELLAAADAADKFNAEVEEYFRTHPLPPLSGDEP